jgi:hypothetical protein
MFVGFAFEEALACAFKDEVEVEGFLGPFGHEDDYVLPCA